MKTVIEGGVRVPDDVSIVGFDGIEFAEFVTPTLTTIEQPRREIGRMGARALIKALNEQSKPQSILLDAPLIVRESTAPAPIRENARGRSRSPARVAG
jgi:LacI family repressor for deo operon, udp, cdd, tsx, nupC, and nupG